MNTKEQKTTETSRFREFFIDELKDIYWAEKHLQPAITKMKKAATSKQLIEAFEKQANEICQQIEAVENVFKLMNKTPQVKKCAAMEGLIAEALCVIEDTAKDSYTRDAAMIMAAQKAIHYGIAAYGTLRIFAGQMGEREIKRELERVLRFKEDSDLSLTRLAEKQINEMAVAE